MDLLEYEKNQENNNRTILLSLKEPSYNDELGQSIHMPNHHNKKRKKIQVVLDDFGVDSSDEIEEPTYEPTYEPNDTNMEWHDVESVTRQSLCGSDHGKPLSSVDLLEEGINQEDIPKEFPQKTCFSAIQNIISMMYLSIKNLVDSFKKNNKKNQ